MKRPCDIGSWVPDLLVGALFFAGMLAGIGLTAITAPHSQAAMFIGFLVWPVGFGVGMSLWYSVAGSQLAGKLVRALFQGLRTWDLEGSLRRELADMDWRSSRGTRVFVPTMVLVSFFAGLVIACVPTARSFELVVCAFTGFGLAYGMFVTWLARLGILPMPRAC